MNFKTKLITLALLLSGIFSLFAQSALDYVPQDATFVISMNPNNINQKVNLEQLTQLSFFEDMLSAVATGGNPDASVSLDQVAKNPSDYGFDFNSNSYFTAVLNDEGSFFSYIFDISDISKASTVLKDQVYTGEDYFGQPTGNQLIKGDGFDYLEMADGSKIAWNDKVGMMLSGSVEYDFEEYSDEEMAKSDSLSKAGINGYLTKMMQPTASIKNNTRFMADHKSNDMHFWMDYAYIQSLNKEALPEEMAEYGLDIVYEQLMNMYAESYISMNMNFDKGAMNMDTKTYMNSDLAKIWNAASDTKYNKKLEKYIKGDEMLGYMAFNYNVGNSIEATKSVMPDMMNEMPMFGGMASSMMDIIGIAIDEEALYNLFKGDMIFAFTGVQEFEKEIVSYEYDEDFNRNEIKTMSKETLPTFTMAMSYGNKKDMMKFMRLGEQLGGLQAKGNYFEIDVPDIPMNMYMALQDGVMLFTNDKVLVTQKLGKGYSKKQRMSKEHCKLLREKASTFYWDIPSTFKMAENLGMPMDFSGNKMVNMSKNTFESMLFTADKTITGGASKGRMSFNLTNKEQNSLEQFFNYINDIYISEMGGKAM